jgi:tRNA(fMet)-specific endonuclease VapC
MMIADSDVLIDFLRGTGEASRIARELKTGRLCSTAVSIFELQVGIKSERQSQAVDTLVLALKVLPLTREAASVAAELYRDLRKRGKDIGMADTLIAGICIHQSGTLLTRNKKHFEQVPGLQLGSFTSE